MVERKIELRRKRARKKKMAKLKAKIDVAKTPGEKEVLVSKIHRISPWWIAPEIH